MPHSHTLSRINQLPRIEIYFFMKVTLRTFQRSFSRRLSCYNFKIYSNIGLLSALGRLKGLFPSGFLVKILKALLPSSILATYSAHLNLLDLIR